MTTATQRTTIFASVSLLLVGLVLGFGLSQLGSAEAGPASQEVSTAARTTDATDMPAMVPQGIFVQVAEKIGPSVVYIRSEHKPRGRADAQGMQEFFRRFFPDDSQPVPEDHPDIPEDMPNQQSQGSGFLVSEDGYILTNAHVVSTYDVARQEIYDAERVTVTLTNRDEYEAEIIGVDLGTDIAVIKIDGTSLSAAPLGDSDAARVGEWVMAVGAPFGFENTVSAGIISAKGRGDLQLGPNAYQDYLQTDAAINPGNSGGPLVNLKGEVIGVNTLIVTNGLERQFSGVGFASPVNLVRRVMDQLIDHGRVIRGWLGVGMQPLTPEMAEGMGLDPREFRGAVVLPEINPGHPADQAGLEPYDVVVAVDGTRIRNNQDFLQRIAFIPPGETTVLTIVRNGEERDVEVTLGERPSELAIAARDPYGDAGRGEGRTRGRGEEAAPDRARSDELGLSVQTLTPRLAEQLGFEGDQGVVVTDVAVNSPAYRASLQRGLLILEVKTAADSSAVPVSDVEEFEMALERAEPGTVVLLRVKAQDGSTVFVTPRMPEQ